MKYTVLAVLAAACLLLFAGCRTSAPEPDEPIDGGVTDNSNHSAPKSIASKDIENFYASFFTYDGCDEPRYSEFTFEAAKDSTGSFVLTAQCSSWSHELSLSEEDMLALQEIIDRNNLVKYNGTDRITAGLPPENGPCTLKVTYASGETLYFRDDGDMYEPWIRETEEYFEKLLLNAGFEDVRPVTQTESIRLFEQLLAGEAQLDISRVDFSSDGTSSGPAVLQENGPCSLEAFMTAFLADQSARSGGNYSVDALYYAYTDVLEDGTNELLLRFRAHTEYEESDNVMVIRDIDGAPVLCAWFSNSAEGFLYANRYGVIAQGCSFGPADSYESYYGIDENGGTYLVCELRTCGAGGISLGEETDSAEKASELGAADICITSYLFEEAPYGGDELDSYLASMQDRYYTYGKLADSGEVSQSEELYAAGSGYAEFMDLFTDNWYAPDEMQGIMDDMLSDRGLTADQLAEGTLLWRSWEEYKNVSAAGDAE